MVWQNKLVPPAIVSASGGVAPEQVLRYALRLRRPLAALVDGLHYAPALAARRLLRLSGTTATLKSIG